MIVFEHPLTAIIPNYINIYNSINWTESGTAMISGTVTIKYSIVHEPIAGMGNIVAHPNFVDADGPDNLAGTLDDDLRLQRTSPAYNTGSNTYIWPDIVDIDGDGDTFDPVPLDLDYRARVVYGTVDMGAYEIPSGPFSVYGPLIVR